MLAMPGVPGIYYHSILGSENDRKAALESGINRRINRKKLDVSSLEAALNSSDNRRHKVYTKYMQLLKTRSGEKAFNPFAKADFSSSGSLFIIKRSSGDEIVFALHNFSDFDITIEALERNCLDLLSGETQNEEHWTLGPFEYKWLKKAVL